VDDAVEAALLALVRPAALRAAQAAEAQTAARRDGAREALTRDLEAARYAADRAFRQYDAADPENRFVAGELEARWNRALAHVAEVERRIAEHDATAPPRATIASVSFAALAEDLGAVWSAPTTEARLKKRIVRTVIQEVVADLDEQTSEIVMLIHWAGGAHTEHRLPRRRRGQRNATPADVVEAVRGLALVMRDHHIAGVLNRNKLKTGNGNRWTRERVSALRSHHKIPVYKPAEDGLEPWLTLNDAAALVGVAARTLRLAAERGEIEAAHPLAEGPWLFRRADLDGPAGQAVALRVQNGRPPTAVLDPGQQNLFPPTT
jgi:DNA-binding Lrp family transcriptional regulator